MSVIARMPLPHTEIGRPVPRRRRHDFAQAFLLAMNL